MQAWGAFAAAPQRADNGAAVVAGAAPTTPAPPGGGEHEEQLIEVAVEICLTPDSTASADGVKRAVARLLEGRTLWYRDGPVDVGQTSDAFLARHVESVAVSDTDPALARRVSALLFWQYRAVLRVFQLSEGGGDDDDEGEDGVPGYREWSLPARDFHGLWGSLWYDDGGGLQRRLLRYARTALAFADARVDANLVAWNRVVLLHGPPGTGKTSLCKALAQKLAIVHADRYPAGATLVEVNAHSLFSKWFSESGKLVSKLFGKIHELLEDEEEGGLVIVLIDEVESLAAARQAAVSGSEPSDAIRAVNALLTALDGLRRHANALVLTTSNITGAIDLAFVDRADIKAYIGPPSAAARYEILRGAVEELAARGVLAGSAARSLLPHHEVAALHGAAAGGGANGNGGGAATAARLNGDVHSNKAAAAAAAAADADVMHDDSSPTAGGRANGGDNDEETSALSAALAGAALAAEGFSGRALRKLPFLAHAGAEPALPVPCCARAFVAALRDAALRERADRAALSSG